MAKIKLVGFIDEDMASRVIGELLDLKKGTHDIYIASIGGASWFGNAIIDVICQLKDKGFKFNTYALGVCASSAIPIFLTGKFRLISDSCYMVAHGYKLSYEMEPDWMIKADLDYTYELDEILYSRLLKPTKLDYKTFKANIDEKKEWLITPKEAIKLKIATGYIGKIK